MVAQQLKYPEALEQLRAAYEQEKIQLTAHISTLEVSVSQLTIKVKGQQGKIKKLEKQIEQLTKDINQNATAIAKTATTDTPESYPYTHPIRPIFAHGFDYLNQTHWPQTVK